MERRLQADPTAESTCVHIMWISTTIFLVLYSILIIMIVVMCVKYKRQKREIEQSHLVPGSRSEQDEWLLVNKLVNEMKQNSGRQAKPSLNLHDTRNSKVFVRTTLNARPNQP